MPVEKAHVKDAPGIDADGELSETDERELFTHYDLGYESESMRSAGNGHDVSAADHR